MILSVAFVAAAAFSTLNIYNGDGVRGSNPVSAKTPSLATRRKKSAALSCKDAKFKDLASDI